jgi:branched-chain amino acid transport system ATP-binding protein
MASIIEVKAVSKRFGTFYAVRDCSLSVERGSITGLIGPNGAGKSTLFNIVAGNFAPTSGTIVFDGEDVTGLPAHELFARGLLRTFQIAHEFSHMSVIENLMMVPADQSGENLFSAWLANSRVAREEAEVMRKADEVIDFLNLRRVRNELAGNLSGGQKKLLELGRTMMVDAKLVLLDEIAAGVNRTLLKDLADNIVRLNREMGYTFFVIEHDMDFIAQLCDPVIVMASGTVMTEGHIDQIKADQRVIEAYFGGSPAGYATTSTQAQPGQAGPS